MIFIIYASELTFTQQLEKDTRGIREGFKNIEKDFTTIVTNEFRELDRQLGKFHSNNRSSEEEKAPSTQLTQASQKPILIQVKNFFQKGKEGLLKIYSCIKRRLCKAIYKG